jgi:hypothetical protein
MLFMEIQYIGKNYTGYTNTLCGENAQYFSVKAGGTFRKICRYHFLSHFYCVPSPFIHDIQLRYFPIRNVCKGTLTLPVVTVR